MVNRSGRKDRVVRLRGQRQVQFGRALPQQAGRVQVGADGLRRLGGDWLLGQRQQRSSGRSASAGA